MEVDLTIPLWDTDHFLTSRLTTPSTLLEANLQSNLPARFRKVERDTLQ